MTCGKHTMRLIIEERPDDQLWLADPIEKIQKDQVREAFNVQQPFNISIITSTWPGTSDRADWMGIPSRLLKGDRISPIG